MAMFLNIIYTSLFTPFSKPPATSKHVEMYVSNEVFLRRLETRVTISGHLTSYRQLG